MAQDTEQDKQAQQLAALQSSQQVQTKAQELVFIDASVDDLDLLIADLEQQRQAGRSIDIVVLQSDRDGIEQITEVLSQRQDLQAIHLVTHGDQQGLQIGSTRLDQASLLARADLISQWGSALSDSADLMLYGCDLAGSDDGRQLIDQLSQLTGADVAASDDLTGAMTQGGDWELEYRSGQVESALAFSATAQQSWQQVLATASFQENVSGYTGTHDTYISNGSGTNQGASNQMVFGNGEQALIRFDNIFGNGPGQIPYGSTITAATLTVYAIEDGTQNPALHRIVSLAWNEASTWASLGGGVQFDNVEARSAADATVDASTPGYRTFTGLQNTLQGWSDGTANLGWAIQFTGNEWVIASSEHGTAAWRPELNITYTPPAAPVVGNLGGDTLNYNEGSGAVVIDQGTGATLTDTDTTVFNTGTVTVSIPAGGSSSQDALGIRNQGAAAGQIGVSGSNVTYGGTTIGSFTGGTGGANLVVTLNGSATTAAVQALIRNITFANNDADNPTAGARTVRFSVYDGAGGTSVNQDVTITVVAANDAPTATITPTSYSATEQVSFNLHGTGLSIADLDANSSSLVATLSVVSGTLAVTAGSSGVAVSGSGSSSVTLTGTLAQINSLLAGNGGATVTFVHSSDAPPTSTTLTLGVNDQGNTGSGGSLTGSDTATINITRVNDAPTGTVSISGTATQGQTLTASNTLADPDGMGTVTYQWLRNGVAIGGATSTTYGLVQADVGTVITVRASFTDGGGTLETSTSAGTSSVANINDAPTGSVTISGTATQGQTLTAGNTLADVDGMGTVSYQWLRNGVAIGGATSSTYALTQTDVGTTISVRGSYIDGLGAAESSISAVTASVANINDAPTGSVTVSGTATQGQTLTAGNTLADADGMGTVSYQWLRNGVAIGGATSNTYVLTQTDVGTAISVRGSYTDGFGAAESSTSASTASVGNINDAPTGSVTISGTATQGQTLTASNTLADVDGMGAVSYQWLRNGVAIGGATSSTYALTQTDVGTAISVRGSYTDGFGAAESSTSAATASVGNINDAPTGSVTISGTATQGQTLTAGNTLADVDGMGTVSYQWLRNGVAIGGATSSTYVLTQTDVGTAISVRGSYTDGFGAAESSTGAATASVGNINDAPTGSVTISGTATQGQTLTASNTLADADGMGTVSYQWLRNGVAIGGATSGTYVLTQTDVGTAISVRGSYTDGFGAAESSTSAATASVANINDAPTGSVTVTGTAIQGQTLTAGNTLADADGMGAVSYQWLRNGVAISGETGGTYVLTQTDVGTAISVRGSYTDAFGAAESATSAATASVANINDAPTGSVTISGTATQGQTLTAGNTLADVDGMGTMSYQWLRNGVAIGGATSSTYVLTQTDVGSTISVRGNYTDGLGTAESSTSAATASVANINDAPTGSVTISGTATQGQTLTAGNTLADVDGMGTVSYQWLRNGVAISGETGGTYVLTQIDVGTAITLQASYTDGFGAAESSTSAATASVANINDAPTGSVSITGTATQGQTLTAGNILADVDGMGTVSYQWLRNGVAISGATNGTYVLTQTDVGTAITLQASYTDGQGTAESALSAATASVANINDLPTGAALITGTALENQTLNASNTLADADGMGTVSYQWLRDGVAVSGATGSSYLLGHDDVGSVISVRADYTDGFGAPESVTSAATATVGNQNDAPTGSVLISGTPTQGQTLTASNDLMDADGMGAVGYQWLRDGVAIGGATSGNYVLTQADVGAAITVRASYTDGQGTAESVDSLATTAVANVNDAPTGTATITGTPTQGQTLTAGNTLTDADGLGTLSYQWLRDGVVISGATGNSYVLTQTDVGTAITVQASYTDGQGTAESATSATTASIANINDNPAGVVSITGTATQGQTLTAGNTLTDVDGMGTVSYQWLRNGVAIGGATTGSYVLTQTDVGTAITVQASYTDGYGAAESVASAATASVANINDAPTGSVTITGTATQGQTLSAGNTLADVDGLGTVSYQWLRDGVLIGGATAGNYVLTQADVGTAITVQASYTDGQGTGESVLSAATTSVVNINDAPTGVVAITGTATQGQTLTAGNTLADVDGLGTVSYQWLRDGVAVSGATANNYVLTQADVGAAITVQASYTDGYGTAELVTSSATALVTNINDAPTGTVAITGTPTQGQTLSAGNILADADGMGTVSYQWLRDGIAVSGATGNDYVLTQADVGATITVQASYTDGQGTPESVLSAATSTVANVNDAPTGAVSITGTPTQGQTLTAGNTLADVDGLGTVSYQWLRDGVAIGSATAGSYILTQADVGTAITVQASYTDGQGTAESMLSAGTATVANLNDAPSGAVTITGAPTQGQTLTAGNTLADGDGMGTVSYQWLRDGIAVSGATGNDYVLTQADVGATITVQASYTDGQGTAESVLSAATATVANVNDAPTGAVSITGTPTQGQTLTAGNTLADADGLGTVSYQWLRDGVAIGGATAGSYILTQADVGTTITVKASYTDGQGTAESVLSPATAAVANVNDAPTGAASITGTPTQGQTLTAGTTLADVDGLGTVSYQWLRDGVAVSGATGNSYILTQADVGTAITVQASYTDGQGTAESVLSAATATVANVNDAPTGAVTITGTPTQGQTLTAGNTLADDDGMDTVSYQWLRDGVAITSATGSTYLLTQADVGATITVQASYTDGQGTAESMLSAATTAVANLNDAPTGAVSITGTLAQGQTLTASHTLADDDGLGPVSYQWLRDGVIVSGATGNTYVLTQTDVNHSISVIASYTDGQGTAESALSAATAAVANINDVPTGLVMVSGLVSQNQTLNVGHTLADADGMGTVSYQWMSNGVAITGANGSVLSLTQADVGKVITVQASYVDGHGTPELRQSTPTGPVVNVNDAPTVGAPLGTQRGLESARFSFTLGNDAFADVDDGDTLIISAAGLPTWLSYNHQTRTFQGIPTGSDVGSLTITVLATDSSGASVSSNFTLDIAAQPASGTMPAPVVDRPALPEAPVAAPQSPFAEDTAPDEPSSSPSMGQSNPSDDATAATGSGRADAGLAVSPSDPSTFAQASGPRLSAYATALSPIGKLAVPLPPALAIGLLEVSSTVQAAFGATPILLDLGTSALVIQDSNVGRQESSDNQDLSDLVEMGQTTLESGSILISIGSVWWAARSGALAAGLLACTPMWRHIDPLPIMGGGGDDDEGDEGEGVSAADRHMAMAEKMFGDEPRRHSFIE